MTAIRLYKSYHFVNKDPIIDQVRTLFQDTGTKPEDVVAAGGPVITTMKNWFEGDTRRPQHATIAAAVYAAGGEIIVRERKSKNESPYQMSARAASEYDRQRERARGKKHANGR